MDRKELEKRISLTRFKVKMGAVGVLALLCTPFAIDSLSSGVAEPTNQQTEHVLSADLSDAEWLAAMKSNGYVLATEADFEKIEDDFAPKGYYYQYSGNAAYVILPNELHGEPLTDAYMMFYDAASQSIKGVASRNTTITNMKMMFYKSQATDLDLTHLDTTGVTDMAGMFNRAQAKELDLRGFDTSQVTNMAFLFGSTEAEAIDVSTFDTAKVTEMSYMFRGASAETLDLAHFDTGNVTDMKYMFFEARVTDLDVSNFDLTNVGDTERMFTGTPLTGTLEARTAADAEQLNASMDKPEGLTFQAETNA